MVMGSASLRDEFGHDVHTWFEKYLEFWVCVKSRPSASSYADGIAQVDRVTFTFPYFDGYDVKRGDRVVWDNENYEIQTVLDRNGHRTFVDIEAVLVVPV
jgi:head-tail adaptor